MANNAVRIGETGSIVWGTTDQTYGYIQNISAKAEVDETPLKRGDGEIVAVEQHTKRTEVSGEYIFRATGGPDISSVGTGNAININVAGASYSIYLKTADAKDTIGDWSKISFSGTAWPSLGT